MRLLLLISISLIPVVSIGSPEEYPDDLPYSHLLEVVIHRPMDAIRNNQLVTTPTETIGSKLEHFQKEVAKVSEDGSTIPIYVSPKVANFAVKEWECEGCLGIPLNDVSVYNTLKLFCEGGNLSMVLSREGIIIEFKKDKDALTSSSSRTR